MTAAGSITHVDDVPLGEATNVKLTGFVTDAKGNRAKGPSREPSRDAHDHHPGYAVVSNSQI